MGIHGDTEAISWLVQTAIQTPYHIHTVMLSEAYQKYTNQKITIMLLLSSCVGLGACGTFLCDVKHQAP